MKKVLAAICLCFITSKAMALGFGQTCRFTCTSDLAKKATPKILEAGGDPGGDALFLDCAKSCQFSATQNMWYTFLANAIYQTARTDLEEKADVDATLSKLGGENLAQGLSFDKFTENFAIELLTTLPAQGKEISNKREDSFMGWELLPNMHPDEFEAAVRAYTPINKYLTHSNPRHQQAGERLVKAVMEWFRKLLSKFETDTDRHFGPNIDISKKDILKDFQKQTKAEKQLGSPGKSAGAWYSVLPIRSCARNCSTLQQGQKAGQDFTQKVIYEGVAAENTLLGWCQQNCEPENYGAFFCGAYDNMARGKKDFKVNNEKTLNKLNSTKNRIYVTKNDRKFVEQCLNLFSNYGSRDRANDIGAVYTYNMTILARQAKAFDQAKIGEIKAEKTKQKSKKSKNKNRQPKDDAYSYSDSDDDGYVDLSPEELDKLLDEY